MNELLKKTVSDMTGEEFLTLIAESKKTLLTVDQVASRLQICKKTVMKLVEEGRLPAPFIGELGRVGKNNLRWLAWEIDEIGRGA